MAERVGFEPTCRFPDKTLSRRPRYDHFGTSPHGRRGPPNPLVQVYSARVAIGNRGRGTKSESKNLDTEINELNAGADADEPPPLAADPEPCNTAETRPAREPR